MSKKHMALPRQKSVIKRAKSFKSKSAASACEKEEVPDSNRSFSSYKGWATRRANHEARANVLRGPEFELFQSVTGDSKDSWILCEVCPGKWLVYRSRSSTNGKGSYRIQFTEDQWDGFVFEGSSLRSIVAATIKSQNIL
ncbi:hypothetical protein GCM10023213_21760 [Prosthecobacter algae]|uniref:Uncharacterized protein n=1 Tax=Prosthecobacter algae TaxID=1144682 RepID=A0ABP9P3K2_9BACT